ncbi:unnamed protein product [Phytomonas sp. EM1]|nr:unnamed protein product [Phytomonas sp. EM1]|eukprot:CCW63964.1 unnamed protein product [Phytomonas sp. isolate EM1]
MEATDPPTLSSPLSSPLGKDVCPVKAEFLRAAPERVSLDAEGRTRGMNKGAAREHSAFVAGTQRPTMAGEENFFNGPALRAIKAAVRCAKQGDRVEPEKQGNAVEPKKEVGCVKPEGASSSDPLPPPSLAAIPRKRPRDGGDAAGAGLDPPHGPPQSEEAAREAAAGRRSKARDLFRDKLVLAPLTTVGNLPFRRVCKGLGADVTVSEMAVVHNLNRLQQSEWSLLRRHASEDLFGIQLAVARASEAAIFAQALEASGFTYDFLDVNCGCPVDRIIKFGCGCGLWERQGRMREVVMALAQHQSRPVSIKCRIGPDEDAPSLHPQIHKYAEWGASAVAIHGRSRKQRYTKLANWDYVEYCATLTDLPVIGNGDIFSLEDVQQHRAARPHITSFMIGRGALIKPWIFEEIKSGQLKDISASERLDLLKEFCRFGLEHWGADERGVLTTRRFLCEWLSFLHRYVPVGLLERLPQRIHDRPPYYVGRNDLETLMGSDSVVDWIRISEMLLGPAGDKFRFTPKHKSNSYERAGVAEVVEG